MIRASCHKCNSVVHYFPPTTLEEVKKFPPFMGSAYADTWEGVKNFRAYDLKNTYTHWRSQGKPPKS